MKFPGIIRIEMEENCRKHSILIARHGHRKDFEDPTWKKTARNPHDAPLSTIGLKQGLI
jgi:hypothetical protein